MKQGNEGGIGGSRPGAEIVFADPWLKQSKGNRSLPKDLSFVCTYELDIGPDVID